MVVFNASYIQNFLKKSTMKFKNVEFVRGLGLIDDKFMLSFVSKVSEIRIEIATNIRIRDDKNVFLVFNDLYLDKNRYQISVRKFRSQLQIEKTYLSVALEVVNQKLLNQNIHEIEVTEFGDIYIEFNDSMIIEILVDTHLEDSMLYTIINNTHNTLMEHQVKYSKGQISIDVKN